MFKINISHSYFLDIERLQPGADAYVSISDHIQRIEKARGFNSKVILNPINTDRFIEKKHINKLIKNVFICSKNSELIEMVKQSISEEVLVKSLGEVKKRLCQITRNG